jgi:DNA-binding NtrC family response regulator
MNATKIHDHVIAMACRSDSNVLITGPTGTGKTTLARSIHERGARRFKPFVGVNLASLHEGTLESELFGHERGSFTGADQRRGGRLEIAQGGTVFLDEIGELTPRLQARLLEFLQSRTISPVGSNREVKLDVRVIAATHRDLERSVDQGSFREDLFHRLRVLSIETPSITESDEDFDLIVHRCLEAVCAARSKSILRLSEEVAVALESYPWPGNYRELRNVLEYAVLSSMNGVIELKDLPGWFLKPRGSLGFKAVPGLGIAEVPLTLDFQETLTRFEREYLSRAFGKFGGLNRTARKIQVNKTTLLRRARELGVYQGRPD